MYFIVKSQKYPYHFPKNTCQRPQAVLFYIFKQFWCRNTYFTTAPFIYTFCSQKYCAAVQCLVYLATTGTMNGFVSFKSFYVLTQTYITSIFRDLNTFRWIISSSSSLVHHCFRKAYRTIVCLPSCFVTCVINYFNIWLKSANGPRLLIKRVDFVQQMLISLTLLHCMQAV